MKEYRRILKRKEIKRDEKSGDRRKEGTLKLIWVKDLVHVSDNICNARKGREKKRQKKRRADRRKEEKGRGQRKSLV